MAETMKSILIKKIRIDGGTQAREQLDQDAVADYAKAYRDGERLPPVVIMFDGSHNWLADGFHRYHAAVAAGLEKLEANSLNGTQRAAVLYAAGANTDHGLRRTNADKRRAIEMLLADEEWRTWSDRAIADHAGVSDKTVAAVRLAIFGNSEDASVRKVERNGVVYQQQTDRIGDRAPRDLGTAEVPPPPATPEPEDQQGDDANQDDDFDPLAELELANQENLRLQALLSADDKAADSIRWHSAYQVAQRRCDEHLATISTRDKQIAFLSRQLARCGKAVDEADVDKIAPAVEQLARAARAAA